MVFRTTSTKRSTRRIAGILLAEALVAIGVTALVVLVICAFSMFSGRSFAAMFNYVDLDTINRLAIDQLTRDVRQANKVINCVTNSLLVLEDSDGVNITYNYSADAKTLTRTKGNTTTTLLTGCTRLSFDLGQRNIVGGTYDYYPVVTDIQKTAKMVNVSWLCTRSISRANENTEAVQTARIVIRKQGT